MADHTLASVARRPAFEVPTATYGLLAFDSKESLVKFTKAASDRLACQLELLQKHVDDGVVLSMVEALTCLATQVRFAVESLTETEVAHG